VSTFYLLPPRPFLGERFATYLQSIFPGLRWDRSTWANLAEALSAAATCHPDVYVVHREDLADEPATRALVDGFGAEPGDEVIEVYPGGRPGELAARRWRIDRAA
jgi:hypothetical protein